VDDIRLVAPGAVRRVETVLRDFLKAISGAAAADDVATALCASAAALLPSCGVTVLAQDPLGALRVAAATHEVLGAGVRWQVTPGAGPIVDAARSGTRVRIVDGLRAGGSRSSADAPAGTLHVVPLTGRGGVDLGALVLHEAEGRPLAEEGLAAVEVLATAAVTHLLHADVVAALRRAGDASHHQSLHDPLTGLPNRTLLLDRVEHVLSRAPRSGARPALLFLDLDGFKSVNDRFGHQAGDAVLVEAATRIAAVLRAGDTLARLGGDEFVVLCEDAASESDTHHLAQRVASALQQPFMLPGGAAHLGGSIGVASADAAGEDAETLLRHADAAMYRAKERGGGTVAVFDTVQRRSARERAGFGRDLDAALTRDELRLHFQPIVRLADGGVSCVEALIRWQHPARGLLPAGAFIAMAEESAVIGAIGRWVLAEACRVAAAHRAERPDLRVAVNVSPPQLTERRFVGDVRTALAETGIDGRALVVEITERSLLSDVDATREVLDALTGLGVGIAIDDFGVGYSSLAYLTRFPVDIVKLDQAFTARLQVDEGAAAIVTAVVGLAHSLGLRVVAEGVEHQRQVEVLRALGCDDAQGFHLGRPTPAPVMLPSRS